MRNIKSLIKDDDAIVGATSFVVLGAIASFGGCIEHIALEAAIITCPAISSAIGATLRNVCAWMANILTA